MRHRSELDTLIADWFAGQPFDHVTARLDAAGIAHADTKTVREFLDHPQLTTRARWASIESTAGPLAAMRPPLVGAGFEPAMGPVPALGQHTDAVLGELGFDEHTVQRLRTAGAV
jgi:crotonobetainyl-CoA:carnitine CoA-transferase CaiB-like acyl-CoA transferase